jgi:hypothetical protein
MNEMKMRMGGGTDIAQLAEMIRRMGRGDDKILAHITPEEAAMLKEQGGSGEINPLTGLPEFQEESITTETTVQRQTTVTRNLLLSLHFLKSKTFALPKIN